MSERGLPARIRHVEERIPSGFRALQSRLRGVSDVDTNAEREPVVQTASERGVGRMQ